MSDEHVLAGRTRLAELGVLSVRNNRAGATRPPSRGPVRRTAPRSGWVWISTLSGEQHVNVVTIRRGMGSRRRPMGAPPPRSAPLDTAELAAIATDHRVRRTFAVIDLCGFTDFVDEHGDHGVGRGAADAPSRRSGGRSPLRGARQKRLGDGLMLVGVEAEPLVGAALAIEQRHHRTGQLELRGGGGVRGRDPAGGDDYVGRAVNLASRLCDIAEPGLLLAATVDLELPERVAEGGACAREGEGDGRRRDGGDAESRSCRAATEVRSRSANALLGRGRRAHAADADLVPTPADRIGERYPGVDEEVGGTREELEHLRLEVERRRGRRPSRRARPPCGRTTRRARLR